MEWISIEYLGVKLNVGYTVSGRYIPATRYEPEEKSEYTIKVIQVVDSNTDIYDLFLESQLDDIYELIKDKL